MPNPYRSQNLLRALAFAAVLCALTITPATAKNFVGDLVYCDANRDGIYGPGDFLLNGVVVRLQCTTVTGTVCADMETVSGTLHPSATTRLALQAYPSRCAGSTFDPLTDSHDGRYLFEVGQCQQADGGALRPWTCTTEIDLSTAPIDCNGIVTPLAGGFPLDGDGDGDFCDVGTDGPFPEGQFLGNLDVNGNCQPDPAPATASYTTLFDYGPDGCSPHNDFGLAPALPPPTGSTRTPGYWKNHPSAIEKHLAFDFCGQTLNDVCSAVDLIDSKGGGINAFTRHGVAAYLNCQEYGCDSTIFDLIQAGSDACAAGDAFDYKGAANTLTGFNESGVGIGPDPVDGKRDMQACKSAKGGKGKK